VVVCVLEMVDDGVMLGTKGPLPSFRVMECDDERKLPSLLETRGAGQKEKGLETLLVTFCMVDLLGDVKN